MSAQTMQIRNRPCRIYGEAHAEYLLLQMTGEHELQSMDDEVAAIAQSNRSYTYFKDYYHELQTACRNVDMILETEHTQQHSRTQPKRSHEPSL